MGYLTPSRTSCTREWLTVTSDSVVVSHLLIGDSFNCVITNLIWFVALVTSYGFIKGFLLQRGWKITEALSLRK